jgi:hypothetical protein
MTDQTPQVVEINCETGVETSRPMTADELAQREADRIEWEAAEAAKAEAQAAYDALKASAKAKLISGNPLTEEEASVLVI